jgi:hypothetical protein
VGELSKHEGGCVCRRVRYTASGAPQRVTICHCAWCQRRTGTAFGVEAVFTLAQVQMKAASISTYRHISDESGRWLDQQFCSICGTNLGFTLEAVPGIRTIAAGTFDDPRWIDPNKYPFRYVYLRSAQNWSAIPHGSDCYDTHFRS